MSTPRPPFNEKDAERIVLDVYGIEGSASEMPSYDDRNFRIDAADAQYTLKVSMAGQSPAQLDMQDQVMQRLSDCSFRVPEVVPTSKGGRITELVISDDEKYLARLLTFVPGELFVHALPHSEGLMRDLGRALGELTVALDGFEHQAMDREFKWDLLQAESVFTPEVLAQAVEEKRDRLLDQFLGRFREHTFPALPTLRKSVVHNDVNDYNVLVESALDGQRVTGLIDFGDVIQTATVGELAIAAAYAAMYSARPLHTVAEIAGAFHEVFPLLEEEIAVLFDLVCVRLCVSMCCSAYQRRLEPDNAHISVSEDHAYRLLCLFTETSPAFATAMFRHACGLDPHPETTQAVLWLRENRAHNVVDADFSKDPLHVLDLSPGNLGVDDAFAKEDKGWGIGRYAEPRLIYASDSFGGDGERRTVHIGLDIGKPAGTPVFAPLDGTVISAFDNAADFDYGPTIILEHELLDGTKFATLYGHLSRESLQTNVVGGQVEQGEQIGTFGDESVNGGCPPHLHFQILPSFFREIDDTGNFPGVVCASEIELWKRLCPDPNVIVGVPEDMLLDGSRDADELLLVRDDHLGPSLSVAYRDPLKIVRGDGQFLYDDAGRQFLDCVNNVCHVGHAHPRVVEAGQRQMAVLNTNTCYLHDNIACYAERLLSKFPEELCVVYFVCSGSEANELALRMAHISTGAEDVIVIDGAYHGNTTSLIDISPYKFDGPGGSGKPDHVHVATMPDTYRGEMNTGAEFAEDVRHKCEGNEIAAFFAEPMLGCGGQIVLPDGYLQSAFGHARDAGALCVVDEVQTGFGRVGSHFWAFETQGVVPDIVTLGKPMGNGHPLAAVVTTREVADAFANGMEYFNTFGGNPVSCAIGAAVLDVIEEEGLQENARVVGEQLMNGLRGLQERRALIGDVRGLGLFIGVELVRDRETLEPATEEADYVINRLRETGVLVSTDDPLHNVLKIKPPIVFEAKDADRLVGALDEVLGDKCLN